MERKFISKKNIIEVLFLIAIFLLVANILASKLLKQKSPEKPSKLNGVEINSIFLNSLNAFALHKDWIKNLSNLKNTDTYKYEVDIPKDLPIPVVLKEIYGNFSNDNVKLNSVEQIIGGRTILNIFSQGNIKLSANFIYDDSLRRQIDTTGILLQGIEKLNNAGIDHLIKFPQTFAALLPPSKLTAQLSDSLIKFRKEYAVLLNDNSTDIDFELRAGFSSDRIKSVLLSIISAYPKALFFVIDDNSKLFNSQAYQIIKSELEKRKIKFFRLSKLVRDDDSNTESIRQNFIKIVKHNLGNNSRLILINAEDFDNLQPDIFSLIKIGYKFVNPSIIIPQ
jgi:hypothetical protein